MLQPAKQLNIYAYVHQERYPAAGQERSTEKPIFYFSTLAYNVVVHNAVHNAVSLATVQSNKYTVQSSTRH